MEGRNDPHRAATFHRAFFYGLVCAAVFVTMPAFAASPATVGGPFNLIAPDGAVVTDARFRGKWMLVFFGYTYCPDLCPTTLSEIAIALDRLGPEAAKVQPIFITVDPERDTPEVMGQYTGAIDRRILGLTGDKQQIAAVSHKYGAYSERHPPDPGTGDYVVDHSTYIYIMNPSGKFVRGLQAGTPGDAMADALRRLMRQNGE
ncbi:SCO family protein [Sinorhizobium meliloti]|uniref:Probabable SenC n=1 Tax=Sinorhizobium meliloti (strain SM11) TaxID=707241 RepID=F7XDN7_SINMM|nr:SCO family protein [Sinorhizobium meliloti]AEH81662.1 probabable SenC [Sinorhizobium meliloti SM11]ARS66336.1 SCO family protein [Sinorhizobium meliloti RU11/001]MBP2469471.1 protein SCO1/2 [Sinorhizobium meliloti]MDE3763721.1 SCO family protein [Sinorhizobium meliloti]MDE3776079.1 SCO family protein [Sinorhizobium meliloti]